MSKFSDRVGTCLSPKLNNTTKADGVFKDSRLDSLLGPLLPRRMGLLARDLARAIKP